MKKILAIIIIMLMIAPQNFSIKIEDNHSSQKIRLILVLKQRPPLEQMIFWYAKPTERALEQHRKIIYNELKEYYRGITGALRSNIERLGGKVLYPIYSLGMIVAEIPRDKIKEIARNSFILKVIPNYKFRIMMDVATRTVKADSLWNAGLNGSEDIGDRNKGIEVAVVDTGVYHSKYLAGRIIDEESFVTGEEPDDLNGHGTMVASIVASNHTTYRGIAYGANIINAKAMNKVGEGLMSDIIRAIEWAIINASDPAEIINLSLGAPENGGLQADGSSEITRIIDYLSVLYDVIFTIAIGNVEGGYSGVNIPADSYNSIAVGAMSDKNTIDRSDDDLYSGSCHGPTRDNRLKPEVVAPGAQITTITKGDSVETGSGTSFATPIVSGGAAILYGYLLNKYGISAGLGLAVKALIINSADIWGSVDNYHGFGYVNYKRALNESAYVRVLNLTFGNRYVSKVNLSENESYSFTVTWYRVPKSSVSFYNLGLFRIRVYDPSNRVIYQRVEDTNNTVKIVFDADQSGLYTVEVEKLYRKEAPISELVAIASSKPLLAPNVRVELEGNKIFYDDTSSLTFSVKVHNSGERIENGEIIISVEGKERVSESVSVSNIIDEKIVNVSLTEKLEKLGEYNITIKFVSNSGVLAENGSFIVYSDDDAEPPLIGYLDVHLDEIWNKLIITVNVSDPSGIAYVRFYWRIDDPLDENTLDLADGYINLTCSGGLYVGEMEYPDNWDGKTLHYVVVVADNDSDRRNDRAVKYVVEEINVVALKGKLIIAAIVVIVIVVGVIIRLYLDKKKKEAPARGTSRKRRRVKKHG